MYEMFFKYKIVFGFFCYHTRCMGVPMWTSVMVAHVYTKRLPRLYYCGRTRLYKTITHVYTIRSPIFTNGRHRLYKRSPT